jgi:hypothetical protein
VTDILDIATPHTHRLPMPAYIHSAYAQVALAAWMNADLALLHTLARSHHDRRFCGCGVRVG